MYLLSVLYRYSFRISNNNSLTLRGEDTQLQQTTFEDFVCLLVLMKAWLGYSMLLFLPSVFVVVSPTITVGLSLGPSPSLARFVYSFVCFKCCWLKGTNYVAFVTFILFFPLFWTPPCKVLILIFVRFGCTFILVWTYIAHSLDVVGGPYSTNTNTKSNVHPNYKKSTSKTTSRVHSNYKQGVQKRLENIRFWNIAFFPNP
jgi:hypothetical protein